MYNCLGIRPVYKCILLFVGVVKVFGGAMTNGVKEVLLVIQEVGPLDGDNYCYERSEYTMYRADKKVVDQGKYVIY